MKEVPVIMAARNEAKHIGDCLDKLSRQNHRVLPVVVVNGGTDKTADIARNTGATVLESNEGKMPALQEGLRFLGKRALETVLILDADSKPLSKNWSKRLTSEANAMPQDTPAIVWGPYVFSEDINPIAGAFFTMTSMQVSWADRHKENPRTIRGGNTGLKIDNDELLEELLAMDNYWPREDVAIFDVAMEHDANKKVIFHPEAWVLTSGIRLSEALKAIVKERKSANEIYDDSYAAEAPPNSTPFNSKN